MEMVKLEIPAAFIKDRLGRPTWQEVLFGLERQLIDPKAVTELAVDDLAQDAPAPQIVELAIAEGDEPSLELVKALAAAEPPEDDGASRRTWLFLVLAWLYAHRAALEDPLSTVELVYADFDHPEKVSRFVRYMPSDEQPASSNRAENEQRLMKRWAEFIQQEELGLSRR